MLKERVILFNGDCLELEKVIPDESIDLVVTDPPYGINYISNKQRGSTRNGKECLNKSENYFKRIVGDAKNNSFFSNQEAFLKFIYKKLKNNSAAYIFCHWTNWSKIESDAINAGFSIKNMIVVDKSNHGMGDLKGQYAPKHELIMFVVKGRHLLDNSLLGRGKDVIQGKVLYSGARKKHPNEKPVSWLEPLIIRSCPEGGTVLDPFMGSGSTGIACINTGRNFIGIEIDSEYYTLAKDNINKHERKKCI